MLIVTFAFLHSYLISNMLFLMTFSSVVELVTDIRLIPSKTIDRSCIFITWIFFDSFNKKAKYSKIKLSQNFANVILTFPF